MSSPVERQQTKWVVVGMCAAFLGFGLGAFLPQILFPSAIGPLNAPIPGGPNLVYRLVYFPVVVLGAMALIPLTIALAVLRYRLWEVDPLINRALTYGVLTAALALAYWAGVVVIQAAFRALAIPGSDLAIVASTLVVAGLFQPVRGRVQETIDRRFYRRKYDAAKILAEFSRTLNSHIELDRLMQRLTEVVEETMQPTHVSVWLRETERGRKTEEGPVRLP